MNEKNNEINSMSGGQPLLTITKDNLWFLIIIIVVSVFVVFYIMRKNNQVDDEEGSEGKFITKSIGELMGSRGPPPPQYNVPEPTRKQLPQQYTGPVRSGMSYSTPKKIENDLEDIDSQPIPEGFTPA